MVVEAQTGKAESDSEINRSISVQPRIAASAPASATSRITRWNSLRDSTIDQWPRCLWLARFRSTKKYDATGFRCISINVSATDRGRSQRTLSVYEESGSLVGNPALKQRHEREHTGLFFSQGNYRVHPGGSRRRNGGCSERHRAEDSRHRGERRRVDCTHPEQQASHHASCCGSPGQPGQNSNRRQFHPADSSIPRRTTIPRMSPGRAPSAIRTPISRVLCETRYDITP